MLKNLKELIKNGKEALKRIFISADDRLKIYSKKKQKKMFLN